MDSSRTVNFCHHQQPADNRTPAPSTYLGHSTEGVEKVGRLGDKDGTNRAKAKNLERRGVILDQKFPLFCVEGAGCVDDG